MQKYFDQLFPFFFAQNLVHPFPSSLSPDPLFIGGIVYRLVIRPITKAKDIIMASMVVTFGVAIVVENLMSFFWRPDPRILKPPYTGTSFFIGEMAISKGPLVGFVLAFLAITFLYLFLSHTYTGKAVQATWQNPIGAALVAAGTVQIPQHHRTLYVEDVYKKFCDSFKELSATSIQSNNRCARLLKV
jgi:branched-subunit amino acid ABC-type transport system permease component